MKQIFDLCRAQIYISKDSEYCNRNTNFPFLFYPNTLSLSYCPSSSESRIPCFSQCCSIFYIAIRFKLHSSFYHSFPLFLFISEEKEHFSDYELSLFWIVRYGCRAINYVDHIYQLKLNIFQNLSFSFVAFIFHIAWARKSKYSRKFP